jgi:hypothetical protein
LIESYRRWIVLLPAPPVKQNNYLSVHRLRAITIIPTIMPKIGECSVSKVLATRINSSTEIGYHDSPDSGKDRPHYPF